MFKAIKYLFLGAKLAIVGGKSERLGQKIKIIATKAHDLDQN